jgi:RNA polymerase sigma factor (sigma-70 family)
MYPRLVGSLSLYTGDRYLAQELAQETLARLCRDWKKIAKADNQEAWLYRVAINFANSMYRRRAVEVRAKRRMTTESIERPPDSRTADSLALKEALAQLSRRQRTVLILRFYEDMAFADIADAMQIPEPTVKSLARRGLERLRHDPGIIEAEEVLNA